MIPLQAPLLPRFGRWAVIALAIAALMLPATASFASVPRASALDDEAGDGQKPERKRSRGKKKGKEDAGSEAEDESEEKKFGAQQLSALKFREIGPAINSGRIVDLAVDPTSPKRYFAAAASGGVWKTTNAGTTWTPIFDGQTSYSIGALRLDPRDPMTLWVGTGENNSQRSVSYGDGVYRSRDGGKSWENLGLEQSEHIGMIQVHPENSDVVYVAAQGPLWSSGGDRGLYKTVDGGENWERVLEIDEHTGVSEVLLDPRDPDTLYAVSYQRARRVWTLINGGPGSGVHKSTDGGKTWRKITKGLPKGDLGRIGIAQAPSRPSRLYAIVEANEGAGLYRSDDSGESWQKKDDYVSGSPQYYQELVVDPVDADTVYSMDTFMMVSRDGGDTWGRAGEEFKHVDNHALWINPADTEHLLVGCDGGIYESFDRAETWNFRANLPLTQLYKIAVDNAEPFYNAYGGTQDNNTVGGPVATTHRYGISNREWFTTLGGDGFQPAVDPTNPDIVYSEWQYGNLARLDRSTGESTDIKPQTAPGEEPLRWNWDSPLIISPHDPKRLYFAAQRVYRSDDRGDSWEVLSEDLSRQLDRNELEIMGRTWSIDAIARHRSTSIYGAVVAFDESPRVEGLLYSGSDDGMIQVREPGGEWRRQAPERTPGLMDQEGLSKLAYVADLVASRHTDNRVYVVYNNHKEGDFTPYLHVSDDRGRTWRSIAGDLPERGSTWVVAEDPHRQGMLYVGTEFGVFVTFDGDADAPTWHQLEGGLPTIAIRDLKIQERADDLVLGTFGRGFWVLDDLAALRSMQPEQLTALEEGEGAVLPIGDTELWFPSDPFSGGGKANQGHSWFTRDNPTQGATVSVFLGDVPKTLRKLRQEREKEALEAEEVIPQPTLEELRAEQEQDEPRLIATFLDADGTALREISSPAKAGLSRLTWDLRLPAPYPVSSGSSRFRPRGPRVAPGRYGVRVELEIDGARRAIGEVQQFNATPLLKGHLGADDRDALAAFQQKTARLQRAVVGASRAASEAANRLEGLERTAAATPNLPSDARKTVDELSDRLALLRRKLDGDRLASRRQMPTAPSISQRVSTIVRGHWSSSSPVTDTHRQSYTWAAEAFEPVLADLRQLIEVDLEALEMRFEEAGAPWTSGRVPAWEPEP